jgi:hypothetical protein
MDPQTWQRLVESMTTTDPQTMQNVLQRIREHEQAGAPQFDDLQQLLDQAPNAEQFDERMRQFGSAINWEDVLGLIQQLQENTGEALPGEMELPAGLGQILQQMFNDRPPASSGPIETGGRPDAAEQMENSLPGERPPAWRRVRMDDGASFQELPDGSVQFGLPNGSSMHFSPNGSLTITTADGLSTTYTEADAQRQQYRGSGHALIYPNGMQIHWRANGGTPNGCVIITTPQGHRVETDPSSPDVGYTH